MKQVLAEAKVGLVKSFHVNPFPIGTAFFPKGNAIVQRFYKDHIRKNLFVLSASVA